MRQLSGQMLGMVKYSSIEAQECWITRRNEVTVSSSSLGEKGRHCYDRSGVHYEYANSRCRAYEASLGKLHRRLTVHPNATGSNPSAEAFWRRKIKPDSTIAVDRPVNDE